MYGKIMKALIVNALSAYLDVDALMIKRIKMEANKMEANNKVQELAAEVEQLLFLAFSVPFLECVRDGPALTIMQCVDHAWDIASDFPVKLREDQKLKYVEKLRRTEDAMLGMFLRKVQKSASGFAGTGNEVHQPEWDKAYEEVRNGLSKEMWAKTPPAWLGLSQKEAELLSTQAWMETFYKRVEKFQNKDTGMLALDQHEYEEMGFAAVLNTEDKLHINLQSFLDKFKKKSLIWSPFSAVDVMVKFLELEAGLFQESTRNSGAIAPDFLKRFLCKDYGVNVKDWVALWDSDDVNFWKSARFELLQSFRVHVETLADEESNVGKKLVWMDAIQKYETAVLKDFQGRRLATNVRVPEKKE